MLRRLGLLAALIACVASTARAQDLAFVGVPWGAPAAAARARIEALGYTSRGAVAGGDQLFQRADGAILRLMLGGGGMVGIYVTEAARGTAVDARYRVLADSLETALGTPLDKRPESRRWEAGLASVAVRVVTDRESGLRGVSTDWTGPGWYDEMARRGSLPVSTALPAGYTIVSVMGNFRVAVDTSTLVAQTGQPVRGRFRIDYAQPVPGEGGGDRYDALEYAMEYDCAGGRTRTVSRATFLGGTPARSDAVQTLPWTSPPSGTEVWRGLDAVCRVAGRGAELAALRPAFASAPAGWVLASERGGMRWLVDSASVRPKSAGTYEAVMRAEAGQARTIAGGLRMDAVRMRVDADCGGMRWRVTAMTALLGAREVSPVPVPPEQAAWMDGNASPVVGTVCRIAQRRP